MTVYCWRNMYLYINNTFSLRLSMMWSFKIRHQMSGCNLLSGSWRIREKLCYSYINAYYYSNILSHGLKLIFFVYIYICLLALFRLNAVHRQIWISIHNSWLTALVIFKSLNCWSYCCCCCSCWRVAHYCSVLFH